MGAVKEKECKKCRELYKVKEGCWSCKFAAEADKFVDRSNACVVCGQQYLSPDAAKDCQFSWDCPGVPKDRKPDNSQLQHQAADWCPEHKGPTRSRSNANSKGTSSLSRSKSNSSGWG